MQEFYQDKSAKVYYDSQLDTLFLEYTDKVRNDEHFITINSAVLNAFTKLKTQKFVADIRKMGIISISAQKWVVDNLLPGMIRHLKGKKLFHAQLLDPSEIMSKVSATNVKKKSEAEGIEVVQFSDRQEMTVFLKNWKSDS